jgi:hypothetical protein
LRCGWHKIRLSTTNRTGHNVAEWTAARHRACRDAGKWRCSVHGRRVGAQETPLLPKATVEGLIAYHRAAPAASTLLTAILDDPTGYGRILRDNRSSLNEGPHKVETGHVLGIVEHRDTPTAQNP